LTVVTKARGQRVDVGDGDAGAASASARGQRVVASGHRFAAVDLDARAFADVSNTLVTDDDVREWQAARTETGGRHVYDGSSVSRGRVPTDGDNEYAS
jgi:hypothetical protein